MHLQLVTSSSPVPPLHFTLGNFHATFSCNFFMQLNIPFLQATAHATGCRPEHKTFQTSHFMHVHCTLIHIRQLSCNFSMQLYQATFMQLFQATLSGNFHATFPGNFHATFRLSPFCCMQDNYYVQNSGCGWVGEFNRLARCKLLLTVTEGAYKLWATTYVNVTSLSPVAK